VRSKTYFYEISKFGKGKQSTSNFQVQTCAFVYVSCGTLIKRHGLFSTLSGFYTHLCTNLHTNHSGHLQQRGYSDSKILHIRIITRWRNVQDSSHNDTNNRQKKPGAIKVKGFGRKMQILRVNYLNIWKCTERSLEIWLPFWVRTHENAKYSQPPST
jgi:hypothetical protein